MGMLISTLGLLSPHAYSLFLILVAVGFFAIYIPWDRRRKKRGSGTGERREKREVRPARSLSRGGAVALAVVCVPLAVVGMTLVIACAVMGEAVLTAVGLVLSGLALAGMVKAGEVLRSPRR